MVEIKRDFSLNIDYVGDYVYIQASSETYPCCYDAKTPEDIAEAVLNYIKDLTEVGYDIDMKEEEE